MVWFTYVRLLVAESRPVYTRTSQVELPRRTIWPTFRAIGHLRQCGGSKWHMVSALTPQTIPELKNNTGNERPRPIESSGALTAKRDMVKVG